MADIAGDTIRLTMETSGLTSRLDDALAQLDKFGSKLQKDVVQQTMALQKQAATFGMSARQARSYDLQVRGAGAADLAAARAADQQLTAMERQKERQEAFKGRLLQGAQMAGGVVQQGIGAMVERIHGTIPKDAAADAIGAVGQVATLWPGPLGTIAGIVTGVFSSIVTAINAEANMMRERVGAAFGAVVRGSVNARQAMADIRLDVFQQGFQQLGENLAAFQQVAGGGVGALVAEPFAGQAALNAQVNTIVERAERTAELFRQVSENPVMRGIVARTTVERIIRQAGDVREQTGYSAAQQRLQANMIAQGQTSQEAADAAGQLAMQQRLQAQGGMAALAGMVALVPQMAALTIAQRQQRNAAEGLQAVQATRTPLEMFQVGTRRLNEMLADGAINADTFGRAFEQQFAALERTVGEAPVGQAAARAGSVEAASIIARAQRQAEREDLQQRMARVL